MQAMSLFKQGQLDAAKQRLQSLLEQQPGLVKAWMMLAAVEGRQNNNVIAVEHLEKAASHAAGDLEQVLEIITAMQRMSAYGPAKQLLNTLDQTLPAVCLLKAQLDWFTGEYQQALEGFEELWLTHPEYIDGAIAYCRALGSMGGYDRLQQVLTRSMAMFNTHELQALQAAVFINDGDYQSARGFLSQAQQQRPGQGEYMLGMAVCDSLQTGSELSIPEAGLRPRQVAQLQSFKWLQANPNKHVNYTVYGLASLLLEDSFRRAPEEGVVVECGVYFGRSINQLAALTTQTIHGFDSFQGLPEDWLSNEPAGSYSTQGRLPAVADHVQLHQGWFEDTLPTFVKNLDQPIRFLHIDCDLYSSTQTVLQELGPCLAGDAVLLFDDFLAYPGYQDHEIKAFLEHVRTQSWQYQLLGSVFLGRSCAIQLQN